MKEIIFVLGGCRSGKSSHALELGEAAPPQIKKFVATCVPHDDEMHQRVARHQQERQANWQTLEIPVDIAGTVAAHSAPDTVLLIDCLTLWLSNLMMEPGGLDHLDDYLDDLSTALAGATGTVILVSNEVGTGIVPENAVVRAYRDAIGFVNQRVAKCADRVVWTVAGIPVTIKGGDATGLQPSEPRT